MQKKATIKAALALGLAAFVMGADKPADAPAPTAEGFVSIFDGKTLNGWHGLDGFWSVKDGAISGEETKEHQAPQTFLIYDKPESNFELRYKYKFVTPGGNSGVQFRSKLYNAKTLSIGGYQADCDAGRGYDGSIYDEHGVAGGRGTMSNRGDNTTWTKDNKREVKPLSESHDELLAFIKKNDWNDVDLVVNGNHVTYTVNGHLMTELTDNSPHALSDGLIGLQLHHGFVMEVQYKDMELKTLDGK